MASVVIVKSTGIANRKAVGKSGAVGEKRVRDASGKIRTLRTLEAQSQTFSSDLTYVFAKNVAKARRENKLVTGVADRVPAKP